RYCDNESSLLDVADLVFIDPVATGFSYGENGERERSFQEVESDMAAVADFIRLYLTRFKRWDSPLFFLGESYGTLRAVGVARELLNRHRIQLNGVVLISTILDFSTISVDEGNDLAYSLTIPSYAAAAWYHGKATTGL